MLFLTALVIFFREIAKFIEDTLHKSSKFDKFGTMKFLILFYFI